MQGKPAILLERDGLITRTSQGPLKRRLTLFYPSDVNILYVIMSDYVASFYVSGFKVEIPSTSQMPIL